MGQDHAAFEQGLIHCESPEKRLYFVWNHWNAHKSFNNGDRKCYHIAIIMNVAQSTSLNSQCCNLIVLKSMNTSDLVNSQLF